MSNSGNFLNLLFGWAGTVERARQAKKLPPEQRYKVSVFGIHAAIYAFVTAACACTLLLFKIGFDSGIVIGVLVFIVAIAFGVGGTLIFLVTTIVNWFCQLSVNGNAATWTTLIFVLIGLGLAFAIPLIFLVL